MKSLFLLNTGQLEGEFGNAMGGILDAGWGEWHGGESPKKRRRRVSVYEFFFPPCCIARRIFRRFGWFGVVILEVALQGGPDGLAGHIADLVVEFVRQVDRYCWHGYDDVT